MLTKFFDFLYDMNRDLNDVTEVTDDRQNVPFGMLTSINN